MVKTIDTRTRFPELLIEKLKKRADQTGWSRAMLIRYYVIFGMQIEDALPSILPKIGNVSSIKPSSVRGNYQRYYIDSDLIEALEHTPEGMISPSVFVNTVIRKEILKRKNNLEED